MLRHLASVKVIDNIEPIEGADRIEVATIGGWKVVVGKGEFEAGDKCVYFEIDSCLPTEDARFAFLASRGEKSWLYVPEEGDAAPVEVKGHVLRTAKLRGQVSQGLVMQLEALGLDPDLAVGADVTDELGILKYDPYCPGNTGRVGSYPAAFALKSDAERVQNLGGCWDEIRSHTWYPTTKVDGYSFSILKDYEDNLRCATRNQEVAWDEMAPEIAVARKWKLVDALVPGMLVQFEFAGPKVQGNRLGLPENRPFVFCVWKDRAQLPRNAWPASCLAAAVPVLDLDLPENIEECVGQADGLRGSVAEGKLDEGVVWHTIGGEGLECLDGRDCFKAISNKYLLKAKE